MSGNLNKEGFLMRVSWLDHMLNFARSAVHLVFFFFFFAFALSNIHSVRNPSISTKDLMASAFFPCAEESISSRSKYCPLLPYLLVNSSSESCLLISIHFSRPSYPFICLKDTAPSHPCLLWAPWSSPLLSFLNDNSIEWRDVWWGEGRQL